MKHRKILSFVLFLLLLAPLTASAQEAPPPLRTISVRGDGALKVAADQASIRVGVESSRETPDAALRENARIANSVLEKLRGIGIAAEKIATARYSFYPVYSSEAKKRPQIIGYSANNTITVVTDDIEQVGAVIAACVESGATQIDSVTFSARAAESLKQKALQAAVKNARDKAQTIAAALNKRIVNVVSVGTNAVAAENFRIANYALKSVARDAAQTPIQSGELEISASVDIAFEIE